MGNNSLSNTEKSLRSIAKRYENVKYSVGLAVLFLMNGTSAFSDTNTVQEIDRQKEVAKDNQAGKTVVKETKKEKKQASQKLKASWVNMQFGANDMYSNYFAAPKAKVEKTSVVKSEKTVLVASADNTASLPMFAKLLTDIEETTENRTEVLTTIANKEAVPTETATPTMEEIKASKQELRSSVGNLQDKIDTARRENNKEINGLRLELIQLMEQGNQVVKSPWSSWQFGANYFYDDWGGSYKGRGDKAKEKLDLTKKTDPLERFKATSQMSSTYGTTDLGLVYEPPREVEVSAGIRPKEVNKRAPGFVPQGPSGALPPFDPKIIQPPKAPDEITVTPPTIVPPTLRGGGANPVNSIYRWFGDVGQSGANNNYGAISQVSLSKGTFDITGNVVDYSNGNMTLAVKNYDAFAYTGTTPAGTKPTDGTYLLNARFFNTLLNVPYSEFGKDVVINYNFNKAAGGNEGAVINLETEGTVLGNLSNYAPNYITDTKKDTLRKYQSYSEITGADNGATELLFINKGNVNLLSEDAIYLFTTTHYAGNDRTSYIDNEGTISAKGKNSVIIKHTPDTGNGRGWIYSNSEGGKMYADGEGSMVAGWAYSNLPHGRAAFVNDGLIQVRGKKAIGIFMASDAGNSTMKPGSSVYLTKPIDLLGDEAIGWVSQNTGIDTDTKNLVKFSIGKEAQVATIGNSLTEATKTEKAIGILQDHAKKTNAAAVIEIGEHTKESIGIYARQGEMNVTVPLANAGITSSKIDLQGGTGNIGMVATAGAKVNFEGESLISGGESQKLALAEAAGKVTLNGPVTVGSTSNFIKDSLALYATGNTSEVTLIKPEKFSAYLSGNSVAAYANDKGKVNMNQTTLPSAPNIYVKSTDNKGMGLFAYNGGVINAEKNYIKVENGSTGMSAIGANGASKSTIFFNGGKLDYDGKGYALYAKNSGEIKFANGNIILRGKSTAMELNTSGTNPIDISNTQITVMSNDVIVFNMLNATTPINVSNLAGDINALVGTGINVQAGTEGGQTFDKYKLAALDGGTINIDVDIDKADGPTTPSGYYFQRFLGQRLKTNVNSNVTARLTTTQADNLYNKQVVGIEANSSKNAVSNTETQVNIASGKTIDVARIDGTDKGGVGVFINYGQAVNKGTISVEKDGTANSKAVGIYSVNGSEVTNEGTVDVSGNNGIGILGMAYRTDASNNPIPNEFETAALGQGKATVLNKGQISLDGANANGIYIENNNASATRATAVGTNDTTGVITLIGDSSTGMSGDKATLENKGTININGQKSVGMFAKNSSELTNSGTINLAAGLSENDPNIGIYAKDVDTNVTNSKDIIGGNNTYGIYGKTVSLTGTGKIELGDASVGIFSDAEYTSTPAVATIDLANGSKLKVGAKESVGVFATGKNQNISSKGDIEVGDTSFAFVVRGTGTTLKTDNTNGVTLGNDATFIYSNDTTGNIENKTALTATGSKNYGIYAAGTATNLANMNFGTGVGNVGMYSIGGGTLTNGSATVSPTITVSASDVVNKLYGIGMAAGYVNDAGTLVSTGNIVNYGTIKVEKDNGIGMFATGSGSTATNRGTIELSGKKTTGMYLDNNAIGYNYGTITTVPNPSNDGIVGVVASNGAIIKNYGTINIVDGSNLTGVFINKGTQAANYDDQIPGGGTGVLNGKIEVKTQAPTGKTVAGIDIKAPGDGTATIYRDGTQVTPIAVDTVTATPQPLSVNVGTTSLDLSATDLATPSLGQASSIGMYVDTSGVNYTNPIQGLNLLTGLQKVDLIFGTEASKYTNEKDIEVGQNILKPYNDVITSLSGGTSMKFSFTSGSLTWIATATQNTDDTLKALYLSKIPYTAFAKDKNTGNFLDGLEQRYGVEGIGAREKALFDKLNGIGKGEATLFAQAVDEMKGHQYSNVQQRIQATGDVLDKEFDYLRSSWSNPSKDSNKIKTFGARGEYNTDTAGVIDYKNHAYGVAYVHEDETVRLGESTGWYAGVVENKLKFKDLGNSKEEQLQGKLGMFKSIPFDENNSLNWTISGDIFVGYNRMNRRYLVVDDIFGAKSRYYTYGLGVKNEISKSFRLSEGFSFVPHAGLNLEYGRFSKIREKSGEMRLEVKANDYFSIRPEVGADLAYKHSFGNNNLKVSVGVAYENELGKVANANNKARVAYTTADWYDLRGEKEDRRGNIKTDLNIGWDNQRVGVTANVGYDTKGENVRGGVGLRVIF